MPLEAISDLFSKALSTHQESPLLGSLEFRPIPKMVHMTKKFFQSKPNDISSDDVKDDVLGFFSLLLTYAKGVSHPFLVQSILGGHRSLSLLHAALES